MSETWHLWSDGARDPAMNMALDEALLRTAPERGRPLLRLYGWSAPAVTIGLLQRFSPDLAPGRPVVRRPTGGGLVDHARDSTYTVVAPPAHPLYGLPTAESYRLLHGAVTAALKLAGIAAELAPCCGPNDRNVCFAGPVKYDVVVASAKVAGAAQRRLKRGLLHQGSILLPPDACVSGKPPALTGALRAGFEQELGVAFEEFQPTAALFDLAEQLCLEKYRTRQWTERCRA
jgi:lipoate-protein ligase A